MAPGINLPSGEIRRALTAGLHFILVHETRPEHGGCTFKVREVADTTIPTPGSLQLRLAVSWPTVYCMKRME